jgi:hypothetical protein
MRVLRVALTTVWENAQISDVAGYLVHDFTVISSHIYKKRHVHRQTEELGLYRNADRMDHEISTRTGVALVAYILTSDGRRAMIFRLERPPGLVLIQCGCRTGKKNMI